jgi:tritrans,polycis-undecaprenyl-diphosphate synthase [geranylgeranyl-diphosphate specific]
MKMSKLKILGGILSKIGRNRLVIKAYESKLKHEISRGPMPSHIAMILDGNRRWASLKGLPKNVGHEEGAKKVEEFLNWCYELGIKTTTLYVLSTENLKRDEEEKEHILNIFKRELKRAFDERVFDRYKVRVKVLGKKELWPDEIRGIVGEVENATKDYDQYYLNVALAYGGRDEIVDAVRTICELYSGGKIRLEDIDKDLISKYLYTAHLPNPEPDLIIRTSGEMRLSNFLTWQSAYSELLFVDTYWPEFRKIDFWRAIRVFQRRSRRFGI